jgi:membrane protein DedA with SNARE-associated domain/rhodanese-related sulfurtransferase
MKEMLVFLAQHGYWLLFVSVLARQACLPVPANLILVAAGALAGSGKLSLAGILFLSILGLVSADLVWFEAGRKWGKRILHFACGISEDPGSCVRGANESFARHGVKSLLISKFVTGLDALAAPLAGASGTTRTKFLGFDTTGAMLWSGVYAALGYIFSEQLDLIATYSARLGALVAVLLIAGLQFYIIRKIVLWFRIVRQFRLARITPEQLLHKLNAGENLLILDVRRSAKPTQSLISIPGAVRIDAHHIEREISALGAVNSPTKSEVVVFCTCPSELTSARVALALHRSGFQHVWPLAGGLQEWHDRGFPVTSATPIAPASAPATS